MQIAQLLAGYSLGEADLLRRAMGKKIRAEMEAQRDIFVKRSVERGVDKKQAASIFDLIAKFAEYGFNKSHAAAYAVIAYQTAWMKANYPVEFIAASMTYDMHNTDKLGIFREEAAHFSIAMLPPDINRSETLFAVEGKAIRYALAAIRNVGAHAMEEVVRERQKGGAFTDIFDFVSRIPHEGLNKRALEHLIKAGAFDTLHPNRRQLFEQIDMIMAHGQLVQRDRESQQVSLFAAAGDVAAHTPKLAEFTDWSALEKLEHEFSAIGFYLSSHPLAGYRAALEALGVQQSSALAEKLDTQYRPVRLAGIVTGRKFKASEKGRFAFVQLSDMGGVFEVSVFNETLLTQYRDHLENGKILMIQADAKIDESGMRLIAQGISLFDDVWTQHQKQRGGGKLRIVVNQPDALTSIRGLIGQPDGRGGVAVTLSAQLGRESADIQLPGKYDVSPAIIDKIRVVKGVVSAE